MTDVKASEELLAALRAAAGRPMTAEEIRRQKVSFVLGQVGGTAEEIEAMLDRQEGRKG